MSTQETKLKAIADAIREKEGSTALIPAKDFPTRILALETGGLPDGIRTISAEANVSGRGDVSGGGMASDGTRIIVRAAAKGGYKFANWTERGSSVSTEAVDINRGRYILPVNRTGEIQPVTNPLLSDAQAPAAALWIADVLKNRRRLSGQFRADPRLDPLDIVTNENQFSESRVVVTEVKLTYNGAFRGSYEGWGADQLFGEYFYAGDLYAGEV